VTESSDTTACGQDTEAPSHIRHPRPAGERSGPQATPIFSRTEAALGIPGPTRYQRVVPAGEGPQHDLELIQRATSGDRAAARAIVVRLAPVVQRGVHRVLLESGPPRKPSRQEVEDLMQDAFALLFAHGGRELLRWDPARGMKLESFTALIARRLVISQLRSGRTALRLRETKLDIDDPTSESPPDDVFAAREGLHLLGEQLRTRLSSFGLEMFHRLFVYEQSVEAICQEFGMNPDAVYQWRKRIRDALQHIRDRMNPAESVAFRRGER